jgi:hypothetical protein
VQLVEILLPVYDNAGAAWPKAAFDAVRDQLTERFGGVTAFTRSPAVGLWADDAGRVRRDDVIVVEVMTDQLDREWWAGYRHELEERFRQQEIVVRAVGCERL